ncbi:MAG TPA: hypothetical protein VHA80_05975 [Solirubrobacterales bacterium]|jgi:Tfp pilus assembly protein PilW|nr:hypothetical protein [Solirubrobacterales bacterium]
MLIRDDIHLRDEDGTTMVELLVGMAMGMIVLAGLTMTLIVVLHGNARVDARVEATDNARLAVTRIIEELHSACTTHGVAPIQGSSTANDLVFTRASAGAANEVDPKTIETSIAYDTATRTLTQTDSGSEPRVLLTNVLPAGREGIFSYSAYGAPIEAATEIGRKLAETVILVNVALTAGPRTTPVADAGAAATVQDSATLRLTPPSSNGTDTQPCE